MDNKKFIRNILLSVLVLGVLLGILFWVNSIPEETSEVPPSGNGEEAETIEIFTAEAENVKSVKIENENETYTIVRNGDNYSVSEKPNIEFSSVNLEFSFESFLSMEASRDLTDEEVPFEKVAQATVTMNDGAQHIIIMGNELVGESSNFVKYNDRIYCVPTYDLKYFTQSLNEFRNINMGKIGSDIASMKISENGKELVTFRKATEEDNKNFRFGASYVMTYPKYLAVSGDRINSLFELIKEGYSLDVIDYADDNIANASRYGIGKKTVIINDGEKEFKLAYGNKDESGNVYVVVNDGKSVCTMSSALYDIIAAYSGDVLMDKLTHIADLNNVKNITFEGNGDKFTLERKGTEENYAYDINGENFEEDKFKEIYREIIGITSDKIAYESVSGTADYKVTINFKDGKTDVWEYISYNERNYVLTHNGEAKYVCLKKNPHSAMENIKKLIQ